MTACSVARERSARVGRVHARVVVRRRSLREHRGHEEQGRAQRTQGGGGHAPVDAIRAGLVRFGPRPEETAKKSDRIGPPWCGRERWTRGAREPAATSTPGRREVVAHGAALRSLARALVGEQRADDAVQETWLRYLERRPATGTGLGGGSRRCCADLCSNEGAPTSDARSASATARARRCSTSRRCASARLLRSVVDAVSTLEPAYREVVMLRWFEGLTPRDIARRLGLEPTFVHTRRSARAREAAGKARSRARHAQGAVGPVRARGHQAVDPDPGPLAGTGGCAGGEQIGLGAGRRWSYGASNT